jgi:hypothetical protein
MSCDRVGGTRPFDNFIPFYEGHYVQISRGQTHKDNYHVCVYKRLEKEEGEVIHLQPVGHADFFADEKTKVGDFAARVNNAISEMLKKKKRLRLTLPRARPALALP